MNITVSVLDLLKKVTELIKDDIEYVELTVLEGDEDSPNSLNFEAYDGYGGGVNYEEIDEVDVDPMYKCGNDIDDDLPY